MIKDKHQYHICGWMINQLHLEGKELQCYAIIYSLSQLGEGRYIAGLKFLAEFMQCSQPSASKAIKSLFNKKLIKKDEVVTEYGRRVFYYCSDEEGEKENNEGVHKNFMDGVHKNFMPKYNNKEYNGNENKRLSNDNPKVDESFEDFWRRYHRKGVKSKALKMWNRLNDKNKKLALDAVDDYVLFCKRSNRSQADGSTFLNQEYYLEDWKQVPACYQDSESDVDERTINFKRYMREKWPDLIYHRNPLTVEQGIEMIEKYGINQFEWLLSKLCERDVHQYYSIKQGIEKVYEETEANI